MNEEKKIFAGTLFCPADPELKARAEDEADFAPYREDMRFVEAIK